MTNVNEELQSKIDSLQKKIDRLEKETGNDRKLVLIDGDYGYPTWVFAASTDKSIRGY